MFTLISLYFSYRRHSLFPTVQSAAVPAPVAKPVVAAPAVQDYKLAA